MNKNLYEKALKLKETLEKHPDVLMLNECEIVMLADEKCGLLLDEYTKLQTSINALLEYLDVESKEIKTKRAELSHLKAELDTNSLVIKYNEQYKKVTKLYDHVSATLFDDYCTKKGCRCL